MAKKKQPLNQQNGSVPDTNDGDYDVTVTLGPNGEVPFRVALNDEIQQKYVKLYKQLKMARGILSEEAIGIYHRDVQRIARSYGKVKNPARPTRAEATEMLSIASSIASEHYTRERGIRRSLAIIGFFFELFVETTVHRMPRYVLRDDAAAYIGQDKIDKGWAEYFAVPEDLEPLFEISPLVFNEKVPAEHMAALTNIIVDNVPDIIARINEAIDAYDNEHRGEITILNLEAPAEEVDDAGFRPE